MILPILNVQIFLKFSSDFLTILDNDEDCWFKRCGKRCKVPGAKDDGLCDFGGKCQTRPRTVNLDYLQCGSLSFLIHKNT